MARKIVITSGKGGVGKTSITATLGICVANKGLSVLLIDADIGLNNLDVVMGIESKIVYDMNDVLKGRCTIKQAIIQDEYSSNLYVLPSQHAFNSDKISSAVFRGLIQKLDLMFDYIFIDCPAGIDNGFHRAVCGADEAIVVTTPHVSAVRDADKVISILNSYSLNSIGIIVNRLRGDLVTKGSMLSGGQVAKILRKFLVGVVPEDDAITIYSQLGRIDMISSKSKTAISLVAKYLVDGELQIYDPTKGYRGLLGKLRLSFGGNYE